MDRPVARARTLRRTLASLAAAVCAAVAGEASAATYRVVDLATLGQGAAVVVRGPNAAGTAVGGGQLAGQGGLRLGLVLEPAGVLTVDGLPGTDYTNVLGANDLGTFVGAANGASAMRAFAAVRGGGTRELPPLPGDTASAAYAVNNAGQAAGYSSGPAGERAVTWSATGQPAALGGPAAIRSQAYAINARGDVVGVVGSSTARRATLWSGGGAPSALAPLTGFEASEASWINATADVVGFSATAAELRRATLWRATGAAVDLGVLPGGSTSQALGINDPGIVVGTSDSADGLRAVVWTGTAGPQDLNTLVVAPGLVLTRAVGISNQGAILALGHEHGEEPVTHDHELPVRVVLLIPGG